MQTFLCCLFLFCVGYGYGFGQSQQMPPQQSLNEYVAFLNQSIDEVTSRFQTIQTYYADVSQYRKNTGFGLRMASSGPLEEFYYNKALATDGLTPAETQRLSASTKSLWQLLTKLDQTGKTLETYIRLKDYQRDGLKQSDALLSDMQALFGQISKEKTDFYKQIQRVYRRYQPYLPANAYLYTEKEMELVLINQTQLLDTLSYYMNETGPVAWPVDGVQQSMLADEKLLATFGKAKSTIDYPAADMVRSFREALQTIQGVKQRAIDDNTFAARQNARHGNEVYLSLIKHYNSDLLSWHQAFVRSSQPNKRLLDYAKFCPVFSLEPPKSTAQTSTGTAPFRDTPPAPFTTKPSATPENAATFQALTAYVLFINESLRQMNQLQMLVRNYQSSAEYYRDADNGKKRSNLTYAHEAYKVPVSEYQLLLSDSRHIPQPYRASITGQAEVLLNMLKEMDGLSIELIGYTTEKQYLQDHLQRSDAILDRYAYLFDAFDQKKEQLYRDVRRIHESYPAIDPSSSWLIAGKAMQQTLDNNKEILFGIKAYLKGETSQLPATDKLQADARTLIANEYQNLKGLKRYGRSNGLCPYSPYEDLGESSLRFAENAQKVKSSPNQYEGFYYFFNNELVYQYNKFSELAGTSVLQAVNQPNILAFQRLTSTKTPTRLPEKVDPILNPPINTKPVIADSKPVTTTTTGTTTRTINGTAVQHDTVYVSRTKVDTVYVDRGVRQEYTNSLTGFATNNMVLLLDVSASMDSPYKLPLLKKSIKSLLKLLRPEDQISVVVYSEKAHVALKPTSGSEAAEIARVIDQLKSDGDTDGNGGIRLAYKTANKQYIRAGNNRIVLATDGEFPISDEVYQLVEESAHQDVYLTVFTFGRNEIKSDTLKKLARLGKGTYTHVAPENATGQLILEAQAKKVN